MIGRIGKYFGLATALLFCLPYSAYSFDAKGEYAKQNEEIRQIEVEMAPANNMGSVVKYYDPDIVLEDVVPGEWRGKASVSQHLAAEFAAIKDVKAKILSLTVDADDHLGFAYSIQSWSWTGEDNKRNEMIVRQTDLFRRVDGVWLLAYQHVSVPIDHNTGMGVFKQEMIDDRPVSRPGGF